MTTTNTDTRRTSTLVISATISDDHQTGEENQLLKLTSDYQTLGDPYAAADHGLTALVGDIVRGWLGTPTTPTANTEKLDRAGQARVVLSLAIFNATTDATEQESFVVIGATTGSLVRAIRAATHAAADDANAWLMRQKKRSSGGWI